MTKAKTMVKTIADFLGAKPRYKDVRGAPFRIGVAVRVTGACDEVGRDCGIDELAGQYGVVKYLEYDCGSGQHYPDDPMVGVRFRDGKVRELWKDEMVAVSTPRGPT